MISCSWLPPFEAWDTAVVRKQYHFWPGDHGLDAWDVDRLIRLSKGLPVVRVPLNSITEVDSAYWFNDPQLPPTVRGIVEHMRLVREVDLTYPIILGFDGRVMDGMHRVARALLDGQSTIAAVRFEVHPDPDFRAAGQKSCPTNFPSWRGRPTAVL